MTELSFHVPIPTVGLAFVGVSAFGLGLTTTLPSRRVVGTTALLANLAADPPEEASPQTSDVEVDGLKMTGSGDSRGKCNQLSILGIPVQPLVIGVTRGLR
jgi:hypothetical protein